MILSEDSSGGFEQANPATDLLEYTTRWRVRQYELDVNGHVNNAVYLNYIEEISVEHAEASGHGRRWAAEHGCAWVIRRHEITYLRPASFGEVLELTVRVAAIRGARGIRNSQIKRLGDGQPVVLAQTEWAFVRLSDGRPSRIPRQLIEAFEQAVAKSNGAKQPTTTGGQANDV